MGADMCVQVIAISSKTHPETARKKCIKAAQKCTDRKALAEWHEENVGRAEDEVLPGQLLPGLPTDRLRKEAVAAINEAFDRICNNYRDVTYFEFKNVVFHVSGGMSWGDPPTEGYTAFDRFNRLPRSIVRAGTAF